MPDQEDQREVIEATRPLDQYLGGKRPGWDVANCVMRLFEECDYRNIDSSLLDVSTIRVRIDGSRVVATARHGADPDECPSCHTPRGRTHTDYCQAPRRSHVIADEIQHDDDRPNLMTHLVDAIDRARANGDRTTPPLAAARSIHPDRGPVCRVEGAAQCRHVYESECTSDCHHTHEPIPVHRCTDPTCPADGPHAHAGTDLLMRHPWCTCHYLQAWRTWSVEPHREGCPLPDLPPSPSTPPTP